MTFLKRMNLLIKSFMLILLAFPIFASAELFKEDGISAGLIHSHHQLSGELLSLRDSLGAGACVFDFDDDGLDDLFLVGGSGQTRTYGKKAWWATQKSHKLYRNITRHPDKIQFLDLSENLAHVDSDWGMGCITGDIDNDGDDDIFVTTIGQNRLYLNEAGKFTEISLKAGLEEQAWSTSATFADINNDGLLDIYVANYINYQPGALAFEAQRGFKSSQLNDFSPELYDAQSNHLYINEGGGKFTERSKAFNVENASGRSLFALFHDFNHDANPDLIVLNDTGSPSRFFTNIDGKSFKPSTDIPLNSANAFHSLVIRDMNNDEVFDYGFSTGFGQGLVALVSNRNSNNSVEAFTNQSWRYGWENIDNISSSSWGFLVEDFDHDMDLDTFTNNGQLQPDPFSKYQSVGQPKHLLLSNPIKLIESQKGGFYLNSLTSTLSGRGMVSADFDNDGDLDVVATHNNNRPHLYVNQISKMSTNTNWIAISVKNALGSARIPGLIVKVRSGEKVLLSISDNQSSFLSQSSERYYFGLGTAYNVDIELVWPDGKVDRISQIKTNQIISINHRGQILKEKSNASENGELLVFERRDTMTKLYHRDESFFFRVLKFIVLDANQVLEISKLYADLSKNEKKTLLSSLEKNSSSTLLPIMKIALEEQESSLILIALEWFRRQELEISNYWLMGLLDHPDPEVVCQTAQTFRFFFQEEEALLHREKLAIPILIRLLKSDREEIVICALNALAESEDYRALEPSLTLLKNPLSLELKNVLIRTLGWLRQGRAVSTLRSIQNEPNLSQSTRKEIESALARINSSGKELESDVSYPQFNQYIESAQKVDTFSNFCEKELLKVKGLNTLWEASEGNEKINYLPCFAKQGFSGIELKSILYFYKNQLARKNSDNYEILIMSLKDINDFRFNVIAKEVLKDIEKFPNEGALGLTSLAISKQTIHQQWFYETFRNLSWETKKLFLKSLLNVVEIDYEDSVSEWIISDLEKIQSGSLVLEDQILLVKSQLILSKEEKRTEYWTNLLELIDEID